MLIVYMEFIKILTPYFISIFGAVVAIGIAVAGKK